eukprot:2899226-Rhodomonas_salina.2
MDGDYEQVKELVMHARFPVDAIDYEGRTPLILACKCGTPKPEIKQKNTTQIVCMFPVFASHSSSSSRSRCNHLVSEACGRRYGQLRTAKLLVVLGASIARVAEQRSSVLESTESVRARLGRKKRSTESFLL